MAAFVGIFRTVLGWFVFDEMSVGAFLLALTLLALGATYLFAAVVFHRYLLARQRRHMAYIWLFCGSCGIFFSRYAIGRSDWNHACQGSFFMLLALPVLIGLIIQYLSPLGRIVSTRTFKWIAIGMVPALGAERLLVTGLHVRSVIDSPKRISRLVGLDDTAYLAKQEVQLYEALRKLKRDDEWLNVHTPDPAWYFLLRWPARTRFFVPWYAAGESLQKELVSNLEENPPQYIRYRSPTELIDGIPHRDRFPFIERWIALRYVDYPVRDGWEIKIREKKVWHHFK